MNKEQVRQISRCERCILPSALPSVKLNENGLCNHCQRYENVSTKWLKDKSRKAIELRELVQRIQKKNKAYDCLIPLSGGKDSTYALYLFAKVHKLKCLTVTFDNGFLTEHAKRNIENSIAETNAGHIRYSVSRRDLLKLYKTSLKKSGQFCSVCMRGISKSFELALRSFDIPLLITGGGARVVYLGMFREVFQDGGASPFSRMFAGDPLEKEATCMMAASQPFAKRAIRKISGLLVRKLGIPVSGASMRIELYDYVEFSKEEIQRKIEQEMGWSAPEGKFEHIDCGLHDMQHYVNTFKFDELTLHTFHRSHLIRIGEMAREEAMSLEEEEELMNPKIPEVFDSFLAEIEVDHDDFVSYVKYWKKLEKYRV